LSFSADSKKRTTQKKQNKRLEYLTQTLQAVEGMADIMEGLALRVELVEKLADQLVAKAAEAGLCHDSVLEHMVSTLRSKVHHTSLTI